MAKSSESRLGANRDSLRRHNLGTVLRIVHSDGHVSRTELTTRMGLTRGTIGDLLAELEQLGLISLEEPVARKSAGRPSPVARAQSGRVRVLTASIDADQTSAGIFALGGVMLAQKSCPTPSSFDPDSIATAVVDLLVELTKLLPDDSLILGLGVGVPGMVGIDQVIRMAPNLLWRDVPFLELLRARLPWPVAVRIANDADLGALAEHRRGAGRGSDYMIYIGCNDIGVGGGLIIDGKPFRGVGGYAGELGHLFVNPEGGECHCGSYGCWEMEIGTQRVAQALGLDSRSPAIVAAALAGVDDRLPAGLQEVGRFLGLGIASLANVLNVDLVVLGGTLRDLYPVVRAVANDTLRAAALPAPLGQLTVVQSQMGVDAVLVGAAELIADLLCEDPMQSISVLRKMPLVSSAV